MDVFVARQPIFDKKKNIYGYELLFRSGDTNGFPDIDGETATSSLLSSSFFTVGLDKISSGKIVFINFTEDLIAKGTPQLFPPEKLMVEILEDVEPTPEIISACQQLKDKGYPLALDDFVYSKKFDELLHLSDIIKIDFRLTPLETIEEMVSSLRRYKCRLLAEKVETYEEFEKAVALGFEYFQGYFFSKPEILKNKELSSSQLSLLQLLAEINRDEYDIKALEKLVAQDVSITYKLLNYVNSSHFSRLQPVSSIRQTISFLGEREFKLFVSLIATSKLAEQKPSELTRSAIVRARFLHLLGRETNMDSNQLFLLGLFSHIDAMLDQSLENILGKIPLADTIRTALLERTGMLSSCLRLIETYESGDWMAFQPLLEEVNVHDETIVELYMEALKWADTFH